jgi:hypothetical protein
MLVSSVAPAPTSSRRMLSHREQENLLLSPQQHRIYDERQLYAILLACGALLGIVFGFGLLLAAVGEGSLVIALVGGLVLAVGAALTGACIWVDYQSRRLRKAWLQEAWNRAAVRSDSPTGPNPQPVPVGDGGPALVGDSSANSSRRFCPSCGSDNDFSSRFCERCGAALRPLT